MKWKHLDPAIGVWYNGTLISVTNNSNHAQWTDKTVDVTQARSVRYWIELDTGEFVYVFGNKMMNHELAGIQSGDELIFQYLGKVPLGKVDKRGIPYEQHVTKAAYHPKQELEEPTADVINEPEQATS